MKTKVRNTGEVQDNYNILPGEDSNQDDVTPDKDYTNLEVLLARHYEVSFIMSERLCKHI